MDSKCVLIVFLVFFTAAALPQNSASKDSVYLLPEVVISADRYETNLLNTASSVTVLTSEDLAVSGKSTLFDILKSEAGISFVQSGGPGKLATVNIRGGNASHTLILIDGIEMNMPSDPGMVYDFSNLPASNIERVEILRGPQSTLYGSDALAGVINIFTKKGEGEPSYFLNAETGSYRTFSGSAGLSGSIDPLRYNLVLSGMTTGGFSSASEKYGNTERDAADNKVARAAVEYIITDNIKLNLISGFTSARADYDQFGGVKGDDPTYKFNMEETVIRPEVKIITGIWEQTMGVSYYKTLRKYSFDSTSAYSAYSSSFYSGQKFKTDWLNHFRLTGRSRITFGIDAEKERAISNYLEYNSLYALESSFPQNEMNTIGFFLQGNSELIDDYHMGGGIRYDYHNLFGSVATYRITPVYLVRSTGTKIKATLGTGFKTPSLFNLYDPSFGNRHLKPEQSTGWDAGFEQYISGESFLFGAAYFNTQYTNLFGYDENFKTINIKNAETEGVEFYAEYTISALLKLKTNYTYTKSIDKDPSLADNERIMLRRPEHKTAVVINYSPVEPLAVNFEYIYTGLRKDKNFSINQTIDLKPYSLVNIALSYNIFRYLALYTRAENILNEEYEEVFGYGTPGFSVYGGVKLKF